MEGEGMSALESTPCSSSSSTNLDSARARSVGALRVTHSLLSMLDFLTAAGEEKPRDD